jgi:hypothetical protein
VRTCLVSQVKDALERFQNVSHAQIRTNVDEPVLVCRTDSYSNNPVLRSTIHAVMKNYKGFWKFCVGYLRVGKWRIRYWFLQSKGY